MNPPALGPHEPVAAGDAPLQGRAARPGTGAWPWLLLAPGDSARDPVGADNLDGELELAHLDQRDASDRDADPAAVRRSDRDLPAAPGRRRSADAAPSAGGDRAKDRG